MIFKIVAVLAVLFLAYIIFFKKNRENIVKDKKDDTIVNEMLACKTCGTFVASDEAIINNGNYYCSKECVK